MDYINFGFVSRLWTLVLHVCLVWRFYQYYRKSAASVATVSHPPSPKQPLHIISSCPPAYFAPHYDIFCLLRAWQQFCWPCTSLLCSDFIYLFRSTKNWKIVTMSDTCVTSVIETYRTTPSWKPIRSFYDIWVYDAGRQLCC